MATPGIKETITHKIELTQAQLSAIIKQYAKDTFGYNDDTNIDFTVSDTSDDRFGHGPYYQLTKCTITCKK